jgi:hypothetical protein
MALFLFHVGISAGVTLAALLGGAALLHLVPRFGSAGRRTSDWLCHAPGLDWVVAYFTVLPLIVGPLAAGWAGLIGAVIGQVVAVHLWTLLHELANREVVRGPRIVKVINRIVGRWRNHAAIWATALVTPLFSLVRLAEVAVYPMLTALVGLPPYDSRDWVNVSRQKFQGLVGHDLIWCLYCDWMTGVWSLGSEMLRNVESFWCPIRFASDKKCANCRHDFPDVEHGWVDAGGTMADVVATLEQQYSNGTHAWFGHPVRITVRGKLPEPEPAAV